MFTRNSIVLSNNIKTPLTAISKAVGNILQLTYGQPVKQLFSNNEQGFAYDPNDLATLYQDAAGTTPVTAAGQPVGLMKDKSGRNNHAFATSSATRPILQRNVTTGAYYLAFDGFDDFLQTNNINFTTTDKVSLFAGVRKLSDATIQMIIAYGTSTSVAGTFNMFRGGANDHYVAEVRGGTNIASIAAMSAEHAAPVSSVVSEKLDLSGAAKLRLRINSVEVGSSIADLGGGNFSNQWLYIGRQGGTALPFNGHLYSLIGIGKLTSDSETIALEKSIAKNVGVTLNV